MQQEARQQIIQTQSKMSLQHISRIYTPQKNDRDKRLKYKISKLVVNQATDSLNLREIKLVL